MKKSIALVLVFVLTLTAMSSCAFTYKPNPDEPLASGLHFELESLPDIGEFFLNQKAEYFFSDGAHSTFEPRDDYGALIPYYGSVDFYTEVPYDGDSYGDYVLFSTYDGSYGLMTADGKIITDVLWSGYRYYEFDENPVIFKLERASRDSDSADIISADGSWMISADDLVGITTLFSFGLPLFMLGNGSECKIYSLDGSEVLDISQYMTRETYFDEDDGEIVYRYNPDIFYADEELIMFSSLERAETEETEDSYHDYRHYTAIDHSGNVLYSFSEEDVYITYLGGHLLYRADWSTNEYSILNLDGQPITSDSYNAVYFSAAENTALAILEGDGELLLNWFNADGELTGQKTLTETEKEYSVMREYPHGADNCVVFSDEESGRSYSIFAEPIEFPVAESEITRVRELYCQNSDMSDYLYFCVFTSDGRSLVCAPNGEFLFETQPPKNFNALPESGNYYDVEIYIKDGKVFSFTEDNMLYVYPLGGGENVAVDLSSLADEYDALINEYEGSYVWYMDENAAIITLYRDGEHRYSFYSLKDNHTLYTNVEVYEKFADFYLIGTKTFTAVLTADGHEILRLSINDLV